MDELSWRSTSGSWPVRRSRAGLVKSPSGKCGLFSLAQPRCSSCICELRRKTGFGSESAKLGRCSLLLSPAWLWTLSAVLWNRFAASPLHLGLNQPVSSDRAQNCAKLSSRIPRIPALVLYPLTRRARTLHQPHRKLSTLSSAVARRVSFDRRLLSCLPSDSPASRATPRPSRPANTATRPSRRESTLFGTSGDTPRSSRIPGESWPAPSSSGGGADVDLALSNVCGKLFARQDSLLRHVRTHTGAEAGGSAVSPAPQQPQLPLPLPTPAHVSVPQHSPLDYCPHVSLPQLSPDHAHDPYLSPSHHAISNPALTAIDLFVEAAGMLRDSEEAGKMNVEKTSLQDDVWSPDFFSSYAQTPSHLPSFPSINQLSPADPDALLNLFTHGDLPFAEHWMLDLAMPMQSSDWNVSLPQVASRITSRAVSMSPGPRQTPSVDSPLSEIDRNHAIRETFSLIAEVVSDLSEA